jgi:hypothetical protein
VKWGRRKWNPQKRWITVNKPHETKPVPIVADAALAMGAIGDGRLIPLVIVDTTERPDLEELIRVQQYVPAGDITVQWGEVEGRPKKCSANALVYETDAAIRDSGIQRRQAGHVDQIMSANGLYIQAGRPGDRFVHNTELRSLSKSLIRVSEIRGTMNFIARSRHTCGKSMDWVFSRLSGRRANSLRNGASLENSACRSGLQESEPQMNEKQALCADIPASIVDTDTMRTRAILRALSILV